MSYNEGNFNKMYCEEARVRRRVCLNRVSRTAGSDIAEECYATQRSPLDGKMCANVCQACGKEGPSKSLPVGLIRHNAPLGDRTGINYLKPDRRNNGQIIIK